MKELFTIVVTHYNQNKYIYEALDSVMMQDYENIELIITDDFSDSFNKKNIINYVREHQSGNIKNVEFVINDKNLGTVKTLNLAIRKATGKYISFFAADDALYDSRVISNYVNSFIKYNKSIITAQSYEYDKNLYKFKYEYVDEKKAVEYNKKTPLEMFCIMSKQCVYASGSTAYDMKVFKTCGLFNENYKLVEDWSYYLHVLKNNIQIYYVNFPGLKHRNGGVSHNDEIAPHVKIYFKDLINIYENEIINDMPKEIPDREKISIFNKSLESIENYLLLLKSNKQKYYVDIIENAINTNVDNPRKAKLQLKIYNFWKWHVYYKIVNFHKSNAVVFYSIIIWFLSNILILNKYYTGLNPEKNILFLLGSFIATTVVCKVLHDIGDNAYLTIPTTGFISYCLFRSASFNNILVLMFIICIIYVIVYYFYYLTKLLVKKYEERR